MQQNTFHIVLQLCARIGPSHCSLCSLPAAISDRDLYDRISSGPIIALVASHSAIVRMASNVNFRELSNRFNMLTLVEATGTEIVHSAYSASQVENMNNMRMRDHAPEELDELNRRLVQIDSEAGDLMKKMKELHSASGASRRGAGHRGHVDQYVHSAWSQHSRLSGRPAGI